MRRVSISISPAWRDRLNQDWFARILAAGLTRLAMVLPESGLAKMNINAVVSRVADRLEVAYFATLDDARNWLTRPPVDVA